MPNNELVSLSLIFDRLPHAYGINSLVKHTGIHELAHVAPASIYPNSTKIPAAPKAKQACCSRTNVRRSRPMQHPGMDGFSRRVKMIRAEIGMASDTIKMLTEHPHYYKELDKKIKDSELECCSLSSFSSPAKKLEKYDETIF